MTKLNLSIVEKDILNYINTQIHIGKKINLADVANECHVAQSTIIKLAKKMGYSGFVEMYHELQYQMSNDTVHAFEDVVEGEQAKIISSLAQKLKECEHNKNIIHTSSNDLISTYLSRKLAMFDIFAPASYDYVMVPKRQLDIGIAFFFVENEEKLSVRSEMLNLLKKEGYYIVVIANEEMKSFKQTIDMMICLKETKYKGANFYHAKALIFIELLLSEYAKVKDEGDKV